ncbi:MAG: hypothetical protein VXY55_03530 [Pseudomonadota bacterium]|nr:hypothetical protein [Pseudomonadota bacterium]
MTQTVICIKWGTRYGSEYVNRMNRAIKRFNKRPTRLICFTDDVSGIDEDVITRDIPPVNLPDYKHSPPFRKVTLWQYPLGDLEGDVLYLDLDIVICGDLDRFFDYEKGEYCVAENWTQIGKNIGNTSCYRFPVGRYKHIFDDFNANPAKIEKKYGISQKYISDAVGKMVYWPADWVVSFKHTLLPPWPLNFFKTAKPGPNTSVVAFTGKPDPDEAMVGTWPVEGEHWKKIYKFTKPCPWIEDYWLDN